MPGFFRPEAMGQQTMATQAMYAKAPSTKPKSKVRSVKLNLGKMPRRRRVKGVKTSTPNASVYKKRKKKAAPVAHLVKGSPAAKKRMAQLRAMQKR